MVFFDKWYASGIENPFPHFQVSLIGNSINCWQPSLLKQFPFKLNVQNACFSHVLFFLLYRSKDGGSSFGAEVAIAVVIILIAIIVMVVVLVVFYKRNQFGFKDKIEPHIKGNVFKGLFEMLLVQMVFFFRNCFES